MRIFISYSHVDSAFVNRLTADLQRNGVDVWIDQSGIKGGEAWSKAIVEGIDHCDAFLSVLSPNSTASRNVTKELSIADSRGKHIYPVICESCEIPPDLEYQLAGLQWLDLSGDKYETGLNSLLSAFGEKPQAPVSPAQQPQKTALPSFEPSVTRPPEQVPTGAPAAPMQPIQPPVQPPGAWLVGTWQIQYQNMMTGVTGYGQFTFLGNGGFSGQQTTPYGPCQINARWGWVNPQAFSVQGTFFLSANPYVQQPFYLLIQVTGTGPAGFTGMSQTSDQIAFQRIG